MVTLSKDKTRLVSYPKNELYAKVQASAEKNLRSLSAEVIYVLQQYYGDAPKDEPPKKDDAQ